MSIPAAKVRKARQYLRSKVKAGTKDISPAKFAAAAAEQHASFDSIMNVIKYYYSSGDEREQLRHNQLNQAAS